MNVLQKLSNYFFIIWQGLLSSVVQICLYLKLLITSNCRLSNKMEPFTKYIGDKKIFSEESLSQILRFTTKKVLGPWLWRSWQSGRFQHQRSAV